ncbi:hypothetical protein GIB67_025366 [Kingdonia uniflora]|uniref:Uncharacterized protein n=1 Tax=Kingdonia uniflora TaxID=39325 RepID=A0A7J7NC01_9MAGN|nr:hypothetical protein GIB67_025366 [Kingdonia uniflora]
MWRRISSHLKTLTLVQTSPIWRSSPLLQQTLTTTNRPIISSFPFQTTFSHHFSSDSVVEKEKKRVEEEVFIPIIATGLERQELQAKLEGKDLAEMDYPVGPFGTKEAPAIIKSVYDKRIVGCPGGEGEDEHDVVWFWLGKDKPHECPVCSQYFKVIIKDDN